MFSKYSFRFNIKLRAFGGKGISKTWFLFLYFQLQNLSVDEKIIRFVFCLVKIDQDNFIVYK